MGAWENLKAAAQAVIEYIDGPSVKTGAALDEQIAAAASDTDFHAGYDPNISRADHFNTGIAEVEVDTDMEPTPESLAATQQTIANMQIAMGFDEEHVTGVLDARTSQAITNHMNDPSLLMDDPDGTLIADSDIADVGVPNYGQPDIVQPSDHTVSEMVELGQTAQVEQLAADGKIDNAPAELDPNIQIIAQRLKDPSSVPTDQYQQALVDAGYNPGKVDGIEGPNTNKAAIAAIRDYEVLQIAAVEGYNPGDSSDPFNTRRMQAAVGTPVDGSPGDLTAKALDKYATDNKITPSEAGQVLIAQRVRPDNSKTLVADSNGGLQAKNPAGDAFKPAASGDQNLAAAAPPVEPAVAPTTKPGMGGWT